MASAWPRAILQEEAHVQGHDYLHRYDTTDVTLAIQHRSVHMTKIADLDVLLEEVDPVTFAEDERLPYWAELWPSSVALAHYTAQCLDMSGQRVLELGCGLGLVGVVAALQGARVLCTDYEPDALAFARHNARCNASRGIRFRLVDWRQPALSPLRLHPGLRRDLRGPELWTAGRLAATLSGAWGSRSVFRTWASQCSAVLRPAASTRFQI